MALRRAARTSRRSQTPSSSAAAAEQASPYSHRLIVVNNGEVSIKHISTEEGSIERTIGMIPDVVNSVTDVVNKFVDGKGKKTEENLEGLY